MTLILFMFYIALNMNISDPEIDKTTFHTYVPDTALHGCDTEIIKATYHTCVPALSQISNINQVEEYQFTRGCHSSPSRISTEAPGPYTENNPCFQVFLTSVQAV